MEIQLLFSIVAGALFVVANIIYMRDMFKGAIKPHRTTWLVFTILEAIAAANLLAGGASYGALSYLLATLAMIATFAFTIHYGVGGFETMDIIVLALSLLGVVGWWLIEGPAKLDLGGLSGPLVSAFMSGSAIVVASIPTVFKIYRDPETENFASWTCSLVGAIFVILALKVYSATTLLVPMVWLVVNLTMIITQLLSGKKLPTRLNTVAM